MPDTRDEQIKQYGWSALPRNPRLWGGHKKCNQLPTSLSCEDIPIPATPLAQNIMEHVKGELPVHTFNHSMRVFYYGMAIRSQQFPAWNFTTETWFLTCLLHDIGTIDKYTREIFMSFEYYGGFLAIEVLRQYSCPLSQAQSVAEAIIRQQDPVETGNISTIGLLIQLATQFDNMGYRPDYIHRDTVADVVKHHPRKHWSKCFSRKIREEVRLKPWCHATALEDKFPRDVERNTFMEPYDAFS